jgi:ATP-binding cassette subfamily F protein uup
VADNKATVKSDTPANTEQPAKKKMGFKEKREFEQLEKELAALGKEKEAVMQKLNDGSLPFDQLEQLSRRIGEITALLDEKEMRWLELSEYTT